mgnify:CR=1 FL=1
MWEEEFDSTAYTDGFYVTTRYTCKKCGATKGVRNENVANQTKWYEYLIGVPLFVVFILLLEILFTPIILIVAFINDFILIKKKG